MAAPTFDAVSTFGNSSGAPSWSHTLAATANALLVIVAGRGHSGEANGVTALTCGGVSMTRVFSNPDASTVAGLDVYLLVSPPTGSQTVAGTRAGGGYSPIQCTAISLIGVDTTSPVGTITRQDAQSPTGALYTHTRGITTSADGFTMSAVNCAASFTAADATAGFQTERSDLTDADGRLTVVGTQTGDAGGTVTHSYDLDADAGGREAWSVAFNVNGVPDGGGGGGGSTPDPGSVLGLGTDLEVWDTFQCAGGERLAFVPVVLEGEETRVLMDVDTLTVLLPYDSPAASALQARRVLRTVDPDGEYDEWLITGITDEGGRGGETIRVQAHSLAMLLATAAVVTRTEANGTTVATFEALGLTAATHLEEFVLPALTEAGYDWIELGDAPSILAVDVVYSWSSPLELIKRLAEQTDTEWRIRRDGTTRYLIDLIPQIASAALPLRVAHGLNLEGITRIQSTMEQATRVYPQGAPGQDGIHATMARNRWRITAIDAGTRTVTLVDPAGGAGPIAVDDQFLGYRIRELGASTGLLINDASEADQTVVLDAVTGLAVSDIVEFTGPNGEDLLYVPAPDAFVEAYGVMAAVVERPDVPQTVNLIQNPACRLYGNASGAADGWQFVGTPTVTRNADRAYWRVGGYSQRVQTNADAEGVRTPSATVVPTQGAPHFSGYVSFLLLSGRVRVELVWSDGSVTRSIPDGTTKKASTEQTNTWVFGAADGLGVQGIDLEALGATSVYLRIVQDGAGTAEFYVDAAQLTQSPANAPFIEGAGPTQLMQEANRQLLQRAQPGTRYEMLIVDLPAVHQDLWQSYPLILGGPVQADDTRFPVTTRLLETRRNITTRALLGVVLSSRPEDLVDALVRPRLPDRMRRDPDAPSVPAIDWFVEEIPGSPGQLRVRISSRPIGARIYYLKQDVGDLVPVIGSADYLAGPSDGSELIDTLDRRQTDPVQFSAYCQLGGQFSPVRTWTVDPDFTPTVSLLLSEPVAGTSRVTVVPDDDVMEWHLYRRIHASTWPTLDGTTTGTLDETYLIGRIRVRPDGGAFARAGGPLAGVLDGGGTARTGIGGTAWQESGLSASDVVRVIVVPLDRKGNVGARVTANRTIAGSVSAALTSATQSALTDSSGGGLTAGEPISFNIAWGTTAGAGDGTHDLRISRRIDGGAWEEVTVITTPVATTTYRGVTGLVYRADKWDPLVNVELLLELIQTSGSLVVDSRVTNPQSITINTFV